MASNDSSGASLGVALVPLVLALPAALLFNTWVLTQLSPDRELVYHTSLRVQGLTTMLAIVGAVALLAILLLRTSVGRWLDRRPRLTGIGFAASSLVLCVLLAECALTFFVKTQGVQFGFGYTDAVAGFRGTPNTMRLAVGNSLQGRTVEEALPSLRPSEQRRVAFMGDSVVYGAGVTETQTVPFALGRMLEASHEVINAGVPGYGFHNYAYYLPTLLKLRPDHVILGICLNDLSYMKEDRVVAPEAELSPLEPVSAVNYVRWVVREHSGLLRLSNLFAKRLAPVTGQQAANWVVEDVQEVARDPELLQTRRRLARHYLAAMKAAAQEAGATFSVVIFPFRYQVAGPDSGRDLELQAVLRKEAEGLDIPVVDLYDPMIAHARSSGEDPGSYFVDYDHLNERGAKVVASILATEIFDQPSEGPSIAERTREEIESDQ